MGQRLFAMPSSTMDTKWNSAPMPNAPSATRTRVRMACRRPREYNAKATRSQMTLISAMGGTGTSSFISQYIARGDGHPRLVRDDRQQESVHGISAERNAAGGRSR